VSVDLGLGGQVREQRGTIIPNRFNNPTRNPTRFQHGRRIRSISDKGNTCHGKCFKQIQQDQDASNKISKNPTRKSNKITRSRDETISQQYPTTFRYLATAISSSCNDYDKAISIGYKPIRMKDKARKILRDGICFFN